MAQNNKGKKEDDVPVDITKLNLQQLQYVKMEFEAELNMLQDSLQTLKLLRSRFASSKESLDKINPDWKDNEVLVPLTGSMYVPGIVKNVDSFIIDVGTGYFAEMNLETARDYFKRKVDYLEEQTDKVDQLGMLKSTLLNAIMETIDIRVSAMQNPSTAAAS